jgi:hypothetical protein
VYGAGSAAQLRRVATTSKSILPSTSTPSRKTINRKSVGGGSLAGDRIDRMLADCRPADDERMLFRLGGVAASFGDHPDNKKHRQLSRPPANSGKGGLARWRRERVAADRTARYEKMCEIRRLKSLRGSDLKKRTKGLPPWQKHGCYARVKTGPTSEIRLHKLTLRGSKDTGRRGVRRRRKLFESRVHNALNTGSNYTTPAHVHSNQTAGPESPPQAAPAPGSQTSIIRSGVTSKTSGTEEVAGKAVGGRRKTALSPSITRPVIGVYSKTSLLYFKCNTIDASNAYSGSEDEPVAYNNSQLVVK